MTEKAKSASGIQKDTQPVSPRGFAWRTPLPFPLSTLLAGLLPKCCRLWFFPILSPLLPATGPLHSLLEEPLILCSCFLSSWRVYRTPVLALQVTTQFVHLFFLYLRCLWLPPC